MDWLSETLPALDVEAECVSARAEEYALSHREAYDVATSRAVARLNVLSELCLPLVSVGGAFIAMKSADSDEEISQAAPGHRPFGRQGGKDLGLHRPRDGRRPRAVLIRKVKKTPGQYPRRYAKIKQAPL